MIVMPSASARAASIVLNACLEMQLSFGCSDSWRVSKHCILSVDHNSRSRSTSAQVLAAIKSHLLYNS